MIASAPFHDNLNISCGLSLTVPLGEEVQYMKQVHGDRVVIIDHADSFEPQADAMVTFLTDITLCVRVADCGNLYAYDPVAQLIGIAHSGWRGTRFNILGKMIETMRDFGSQASDIHIRSWPAICGQCYSFWPEIVDLFDAMYYHLGDDGQQRLDLSAIRHDQALDAWILSEHYSSSPLCSYEDPQCYSYRRNQTSQRMIGSIRLQ